MPLAAAGAEPPPAEGLAPLDCVINPSVVADLGSGVPGILSAVSVDRSDLVTKGQTVAELESSVEALALELARARAEMEAEVELRRVNAAFGQRQSKRTQDLYQRQVISTNDMDERKTEARLARLELQHALENQQLARLEQQRAVQVLRRRTIESPISGVVMERFKTVGEYVEDQPVVRVAQLDPLHVEVFVPVEQLGAVSEGMHAQVWSESIPGSRWEAAVSRVDRVADVASGTYGVRLELPNPDYKVPAGLRCQVQFVAVPPDPVVTEAPSAPAETDSNPEPVRQTADAQPIADESRATAILAGLARASAREEASMAQLSASASVPSKPGVDRPSDRDLGPGSEGTAAMTEVSSITTVPPGSASSKPRTADTAASPSRSAAATTLVDTEVENGPEEPAAKAVLRQVAEVKELPQCRLAGPFDSAATAKRKARALQASGLEAKVEERSMLVQEGLRVVSEQLASRTAAAALHKRLQAAGIKDLYIVTRGKYTDRVALGLYKNERPAQERVEQLTALGFAVEIQPWLQRKDQYFIAAHGVPTAVGARLLADLPAAPAIGATDNGACEQFASR